VIALFQQASSLSGKLMDPRCVASPFTVALDCLLARRYAEIAAIPLDEGFQWSESVVEAALLLERARRRNGSLKRRFKLSLFVNLRLGLFPKAGDVGMIFEIARWRSKNLCRL
jgi:hypothetical protein